jgi:hypothetical protein
MTIKATADIEPAKQKRNAATHNERLAAWKRRQRGLAAMLATPLDEPGDAPGDIDGPAVPVQ